MNFPRLPSLAAALGLAALLAACSKPAPPSVPDGDTPPQPTKIRFKTDWFPQAEHGGFYQADGQGVLQGGQPGC
jgi:NitT/TauT family transport system substrate-binding protein